MALALRPPTGQLQVIFEICRWWILLTSKVRLLQPIGAMRAHHLVTSLALSMTMILGCSTAKSPFAEADGQAPRQDSGPSPTEDSGSGSDAQLFSCTAPGKACNAHDPCAIEPVCGADLLCRPRAYQDCDDGLACTQDSCKGLGLCENTPRQGFCKLSVKSAKGAALRCFKQGQASPADACLACDATNKPLVWSPRNGGACDDGNACTRGDYCQNGSCKGAYYGDLCADGYGCTTDRCDGKGGCLGSTLKAGYCLINGVCFKDQAPSPANGCQQCDAAKSPSSWSAIPSACKQSPFVMDGNLDAAAKKVSGGSKTMPLYLALSNDHLYLATHDAGEGNDNFIVFSLSAGGYKAAPWGKAGSLSLGGKVMFLADENDNGYCGFYESGSHSGKDKLLAACGPAKAQSHYQVATRKTNGGWLEGSVNLRAVYGKVPAQLYFAVAAYGNNNYGKLIPAAQTPPTKNYNGNIETSELLGIKLPGLTVVK